MMRDFSDLKNCYIIAEAGVNHNADVNLAIKLVDAAKESGANAVKFQLFKIKEQVSNLAINAPYQRKGSGEETMIAMAKHYDLEWNAHYKIRDYCRKVGIDYLSSCCDIDAIDFLVDELEANAIKISSGEITNLQLLKHASKKNVPIILSTGMASLEEIDIAVNEIKKNYNSTLIILHCVSNYPADEDKLNLNTITTLKKKYGLQMGYSDHSLGNHAAIAAIALGSKVIEKHFTLDKSLPGPDHFMALNPAELKEFVSIIRNTEKMVGKEGKFVSKEEEEMKAIFRRGLISSKKIKKGEKIDYDNTALKRPVLGIDAIYFDQVIGRRVLKDLEVDSPISWDLLESSQ